MILETSECVSGSKPNFFLAFSLCFLRDVADPAAQRGPARPGAGDDPVPGVRGLLPRLRRHGVQRGDDEHAAAAGAHGPLHVPVSATVCLIGAAI